MYKKCFLEGPIQTGKSTLIRKVLGDHLKECGGFASQRLIDASGQTKGFRIGPAAITPLTAPLAAMLPRSGDASGSVNGTPAGSCNGATSCSGDAPVGDAPVLPHVLLAPGGAAYDNVFKYFGDDGRVYKDQSVFDKAGAEFLSSCEGKPLILLDEIGGSELLCEPFCKALEELLASGVPCLGVLKLAESARHMQRSYGGNAILERNLKLRRQILEEWDGRILYYDRAAADPADGVSAELRTFLNGIFR